MATLVALCTSLLLSCGCPPIRNPSSKFDHPSSFVHVFVFVFSVFFVICLRPTALGLAATRHREAAPPARSRQAGAVGAAPCVTRCSTRLRSLRRGDILVAYREGRISPIQLRTFPKRLPARLPSRHCCRTLAEECPTQPKIDKISTEAPVALGVLAGCGAVPAPLTVTSDVRALGGGIR